MAWNEQYARMLEQMKKNSVTNTAITGADSEEDEPDCLFYTNFTRETAIAFYNVFEGFKDYYKSNPSFAVDRLKNNLKMQINEMGDLCPLEVLLYSARIIRDYLSNRAVKLALIATIQQYIPENLKSVQYILSGWEWPQILSIVIEACGKTNDAASIKMAMKYCPKIAQKFVDKNNNELLKSYITMIENSQNDDYVQYIVQIATLPQFEEDNNLNDYLIQKLKRSRFLQIHKNILSKEIHAKASNYSLKRGLEKIMDLPQGDTDNNEFSMNGLNHDKKVERILNMDFTQNTSNMLKNFEMSRETDNDIVLLTCKKLLADIPSMIRDSDKHLSLILVGTKGSRIHTNSLTEEVINIKERYPELKATAMITLAELEPQKYPLENAMNQLIIDDEISSWEWAVGKYFRFRKTNFEKTLTRSISELISHTNPEELAVLLSRFQKLIELFNGNNKLLSTQTATQENIIAILKIVINDTLTEKAASKLIELLEFMLPFCTDDVLLLLDKLKLIAENSKYECIVEKVNEVIKKGDLAREPD